MGLHTLEEKRGTDPRGCLVEGKGTHGEGRWQEEQEAEPRESKVTGSLRGPSQPRGV